MDKKIKIISTVVGVVFVVSLTVLVNVLISNEVERSRFIGLDSEHMRTVRVSGEGEVSVAPNVAKVSFAVVTEDSSTEDALNENNTRAEELINYLKNEGIEDNNIRTKGFTVRPLYEQIEDRRTLYGYRVTNSVETYIEDMERVSSLIDGAVRAGANEVNSVQFLVEEEEEYKNEARKKAIEDAKRKAQETSSALGVKVGRVISFSEERDYYAPIQERMDAVEGQVPIEPGESDITVNVTVEYEIR